MRDEKVNCFPPVVGPRQHIVFTPPLIEIVRDRAGFSGLSIDAQGRVTTALQGEGARATFVSTDQMRAVADALTAVALQMDLAAALAAEGAASELAAIVSKARTPAQGDPA
jgi:hypothetical protein